MLGALAGSGALALADGWKGVEIPAGSQPLTPVGGVHEQVWVDFKRGATYYDTVARGITPNGDPLKIQMTGDGRVSSFCEALSPLAVQQIVEGVGRERR